MNFDWKIAFVSGTHKVNEERAGSLRDRCEIHAEQHIGYADDDEDQTAVTIQTRLRHDAEAACDCALTLCAVNTETNVVVSQMSSRTVRLEPHAEICFEQRMMARSLDHQPPDVPASYALHTFIYVNDDIVHELTAQIGIDRPCVVAFLSETFNLLPRE